MGRFEGVTAQVKNREQRQRFGWVLRAMRQTRKLRSDLSGGQPSRSTLSSSLKQQVHQAAGDTR